MVDFFFFSIFKQKNLLRIEVKGLELRGTWPSAAHGPYFPLIIVDAPKSPPYAPCKWISQIN